MRGSEQAAGRAPTALLGRAGRRLGAPAQRPERVAPRVVGVHEGGAVQGGYPAHQARRDEPTQPCIALVHHTPMLSWHACKPMRAPQPETLYFHTQAKVVTDVAMSHSKSLKVHFLWHTSRWMRSLPAGLAHSPTGRVPERALRCSQASPTPG